MRAVPFSPAHADVMVGFCAAHGSPYDRPLLRRLMLELSSDPAAGVLVVEDGGGAPVLVAVVIDRTSNGADAATLELLGVRAPIPGDVFARCVVAPAVAFARGGERRALQVPLAPLAAGIADVEAVLRAAGFAHAYDSFEMSRPAGAPESEPTPPLAAGWRWQPLDVARAGEAHAALAEMFRHAPATNLPPLADFSRAVASGAAPWQVLLDGERVAGLVHVVARPGGGGELRILGRAPVYRGAGLGPRLVAEGLRLLFAAGPGEVSLAVEARNEDALALYRRAGFEVLARVPTFALRLRG